MSYTSHCPTSKFLLCWVKGAGIGTSGPFRGSLKNNAKSKKGQGFFFFFNSINKPDTFSTHTTFWSSFTLGFLLSIWFEKISLNKYVGLEENYLVMDTATTNPIQELGKWLVLFSKIKCHLLQYSVLDSTVRKKNLCLKHSITLLCCRPDICHKGLCKWQIRSSSITLVGVGSSVCKKWKRTNLHFPVNIPGSLGVQAERESSRTTCFWT